MKKNNKKYYLIGGLLVILIVTVFGILYYVNYSKNNYSFSEKSWINSNTQNIIVTGVQGYLPVFSDSGQGVFYDYLDKIGQDTGLNFNVSVDGNADYTFQEKNILSSGDLLFYTDHFVLISSRENSVSDLSTIKGQTIAVIDEDKEYISSYLKDYNFVYGSMESFDDIVHEMDDSVIYAIVPMYKYMKDILYNKYHIVYHIEGLHSHYVLSRNDSESTLSNIFEKFFNKWNSNLMTSINKHFLSLYNEAYNLSELERETVSGDDIIVGYIDNLPYEGRKSNKFSGVTNEYLSLFANMTGATYKYIKYENIDKLNEALSEKKVDLVMNYYNVSNENYLESVSLGNINYVIVTHQDNVIPVESLESIKDDSIKMVNNTKLFNYIRSKDVTVTVYDTYKDLFDAMDYNDILIVEKSTYDYYRNTKLKNYVIKYIGTCNSGNSFLLNKDNSVLNNMFDFYLSTLGTRTVNNMAVSNSLEDSNSSVVIQFIFGNLTYILALVFAVSFLIFKLQKRVKVTKKIRKEDKMMYLDVMTNLKNRNYLNDNLAYWETNKIYPQAVVVMDLNDIAVINDTKGHEEGDRQIKAAASILIKTQRENSEIIRTDGNEFLVYMVGYDEKQIVTYVNKLLKELKELPYNYGASIGYSLINAESTTIDDAINEALIMMRKNKGE